MLDEVGIRRCFRLGGLASVLLKTRRSRFAAIDVAMSYLHRNAPHRSPVHGGLPSYTGRASACVSFVCRLRPWIKRPIRSCVLESSVATTIHGASLSTSASARVGAMGVRMEVMVR